MAKHRGAGSRSQSFANKSGQATPIDISKSPAKNLAHVPCKFFKQGTCQAGNSCPFSHAMDSKMEATPCKYFQKGNCKFGVKCALAHILPDGRRVNPKSLAQAYQVQHSSGNSASHSSNRESNSNLSSNLNNKNTNDAANNGNGFLSHPPTSQYPSVSPQNILSSPHPMNGFTSGFDNGSIQGTSPSYSSQLSGIMGNSGRNSLSSNSAFLVQGTRTSPAIPRTASMNDARPSTFASSSIWSTNALASDTLSSSKPSFYSSRSVSHSASFRPNFQSMIKSSNHESAIVDDDDDGEMFEEDFVPSSLSDLLTPQELQRRGSRPSGSRLQAISQLKTTFDVDEADEGFANGTDPDESEMQFKMDDDEFNSTPVQGSSNVGFAGSPGRFDNLNKESNGLTLGTN